MWARSCPIFFSCSRCENDLWGEVDFELDLGLVGYCLGV